MTLRRTALARRTELARTPLQRRKALSRVAAATRTVRRQRSRRARDTGPDQATKALLWERAKGRCEICGRDLNGSPFSRSVPPCRSTRCTSRAAASTPKGAPEP